MDYTRITQMVVNNMNGFIIGGVVGNVIKNFRPRFTNRALDLAADVSGIVTGWVVGKMIHDRIRPAAEARVEETFATIRRLFKKTPTV